MPTDAHFPLEPNVSCSKRTERREELEERLDQLRQFMRTSQEVEAEAKALYDGLADLDAQAFGKDSDLFHTLDQQRNEDLSELKHLLAQAREDFSQEMKSINDEVRGMEEGAHDN